MQTYKQSLRLVFIRFISASGQHGEERENGENSEECVEETNMLVGKSLLLLCSIPQSPS